jgi:DNA-directed RNA polymerase subunit omega
LRYANNKERDRMIYPSIDKLLTKVGSKYLLVNLVSKRAKEMQETEYYQMKENEYISSKEIGKALEEISKDLIHIEE